jgi:hypothetical protein
MRRNLLTVSVERAPTSAELDTTRRLWRVSRAAPVAAAMRPFLLVTPLGLARRDDLARALDEADVSVVDRHQLPGWSVVSTLVYARSDDDARLRLAATYADAWQQLGLPDACERWALRGHEDLARLRAIKEELRMRLGAVRARLDGSLASLPAGSVLHLNPFHSPDPDRVDLESAVLDHLQLTAF